jgi:hypothetical protein
VIVRIRGRELPGTDFVSDGEPIHNLHVGTQVGRDPTDLVRADAASAEWIVEVNRVDDDWRGKAVQGRRGERFLYLTWGDVKEDGTFAMFRRAKLVLDRIDPSVVARAEAGGELVADVVLTDEHGCPKCARMDPPYLAWSVP